MIVHDVKQLDPEWFALRAGKPTSSTFTSLVTATGRLPKSLTPYARKLAAELLRGKPKENGFDGNKSTRRGQELEPQAIEYYEFITDREVTPIGFVTDDLIRFGASTDGLVNVGNGLVEVKCLEEDKHIEAVIHYDATGEMLEERKPQVQGELMVTERKWADLIYYHPDLRSIIIRVYPDLEYHALLKSQITKVLIERDRIVKVMRK